MDYVVCGLSGSLFRNIHNPPKYSSETGTPEPLKLPEI
jgi:hypothetical protein